MAADLRWVKNAGEAVMKQLEEASRNMRAKEWKRRMVAASSASVPWCAPHIWYQKATLLIISPPAQRSTTRATAGGSFCAGCGAKLEGANKFCFSCGQ